MPNCHRVSEPSAAVRARSRMQVCGHVTRTNGRTAEGIAEIPGAYRLTTMAAMESARRVLHDTPPAGYYAPSSASGVRFLESLPECDVLLGESFAQLDNYSIIAQQVRSAATAVHVAARC